MSAAVTAGELFAQLDRWHIRHQEVVRGDVKARDHHRPGAYGNMHGLLFHHTGPFSSVAGMVSMIWNGRPDLSGPLAHATLAPDGLLYVTSLGRANHAGMGASNVAQALLDDRPAPAPGPDALDGNAQLYGLEIMSAGASTSVYPDVQVEAAVRYGAALFEHHGWKGTSALRHGGWTRRKVDTAGRSAHGDQLTQAFWQAEVQRALDLGPDAYTYPAASHPDPLHHTGEDETVTPADIDAIAAAVTHRLQSAPIAISAADADGAYPAYSKAPAEDGSRAYSTRYWTTNAAVTLRRVAIPLLRQVAADVAAVRAKLGA